MKKFAVDPEVFKILPNYCLGVVVARGINNREQNAVIHQRMEEQQEAFRQEFAQVNLKEYPGICVYRDAFYKLNMNPNKFMCSIEALAKRVQKGSRLPNINSIVDLGNVMSLKYVLPMGAHDIDRFDGDMMVRFSTEEDHFQPLGEEAAEKMPTGELVYASGNTVKTRRWIWRQSDDGKITEDTSYALFPIDGFEGVNDDKVQKARRELAEFLKEQFGCEPETGYINSQNPEFWFE